MSAARLGRWFLPPLAVAALSLALAGPYTRALAAAREVVVSVVPPAEPPLAVQVLGARTRVVGTAQTKLLRTAGVAWNLPVLICLWAWVLGRRWTSLAVLVVAFAACHVVVYDLEVRSVAGTASGWVYAVPRAWRLFLAALLPAVAVAVGWATGAARPRA